MLQVLAAFIFFTRLPFWKIAEVPADAFRHVVCRWPLVGWLTAGLSVLVLYSSALVLPASVALLLAILTRLLVTGCLHEDGLADFFDGFGGGTSRERTLEIMKDSHIGSYGVIGLIFYFALYYAMLHALPLPEQKGRTAAIARIPVYLPLHERSEQIPSDYREKQRPGIGFRGVGDEELGRGRCRSLFPALV